MKFTLTSEDLKIYHRNQTRNPAMAVNIALYSIRDARRYIAHAKYLANLKRKIP